LCSPAVSQHSPHPSGIAFRIRLAGNARSGDQYQCAGGGTDRGVAGTAGPLFGGLLFTVAQDEFGALGVSQLFTGVAIVVVIVLFPKGMAGAFGSARAALALPFKSATGRN